MTHATLLTGLQLKRIRAFTTPRHADAGEILYEWSDSTPPLYVVRCGQIRIVALGAGVEHTVTTYAAGQFSGEPLLAGL